MAITDLTNTTWYVPSGWYATASYGIFNINFSSPSFSFNTDFSILRIGYSGPPYLDEVESRGGMLMFGDIAFDPAYELCINFTGGDDVTNADLISWLETYGIQLKVTDLTDTTWNVPAGWEAEAGYGAFSITGTLNVYHNSSEFIVMGIGYNSGSDTDAEHIVSVVGGYGAAIYDPTQTLIFTFTGGTDVTNHKLIAWLSQYGELQEEEAPTPTLTYDLTQLDLPEGTYSITVVAKVDGYSNSVQSNAVEYVVKNTYAIQITFSTDAGNGQSTFIGIYDSAERDNELYYEYLVGKETMNPKTITVYTDTGELYIDTMYGIDTMDTTGGVVYDSNSGRFVATGDGTITIELDAD